MATIKSGASNGAKKIKPFDEQSTNNAKGQQIARSSNMPSYVWESFQRQYGKGSSGYSIEDKKNVIDWNIRMKA